MKKGERTRPACNFRRLAGNPVRRDAEHHTRGRVCSPASRDLIAKILLTAAGFFIDDPERCFSVHDVLSRLRDFLSFRPNSPSDFWLSSKAYFEHFSTLRPPGLRYTEWASACENARKPAKTPHKKHPLFDPASPYLRGQYPDTFVVCIPGGRVAGGKGVVVSHDDKLLYDVSVDWSAGPRDVSRHPLLHKKKLPRAERLPGVSAVLATSESAGFFHWMTDALPRLAILQRDGSIPWNKIDHFLIGEGCRAIRESLRLLGVDDSEACRHTARHPFFVRLADRSIVPWCARQCPALGDRISKETISDVVSLAKVEP